MSCFERSFASHPKSSCWNHQKNAPDTPRNVPISSGKKYWFTCNCDHDFSARLSNVTCKNPTWCPYCKNKTESKFLSHLKTLQYTTTYQAKFDWCRSIKHSRHLPFDFCIEELNLIIEIDGRQHFEQVSNWACPLFTLRRDKRKMSLAASNGFSIIRFFQEDIYLDTIDWKNILDHCINTIQPRDILCVGDIYDNHFGRIVVYIDI